jgi:tape measure domain-containing protein
MADDIVIRFLSTDGVTPTAQKVTGSINVVKKTGTEATGAMSALGSTLGKLGAAAGLVTVAKQLADISVNSALVYDKFENVRKALGLMTGSTQAGNELYGVMQDLAARTPFTFDDIAQGTQKLLAMGFTAKQIPATMTAIGDASSAVGGGAEGVNRITLALGQMQAKGKITTEEMMQLQEMGVPAFRILADATGVSQQALMDMVSKGIIPAEQNLQTLIDGMSKNYGGMMSQQMDTATQAQSNFQDATDRASQALGEIASPSVKIAFNWLTQALDWATDGMKEFNTWLNWADQSLIEWQMRLRGATDAQIAGALAMRDSSAVTKEHAQDAYVLNRAYGSMTGGIQQSTSSLNINTSALKGTSGATNKLAQDEKSLKTAVDSLRTSFLSIASAQRDVKRTREALEDATNPETLESYQIAADRAYYSNELLTNEITRMTERQRQVRAQLQQGNLSQEQRNELQAEDVQITEEMIGKNLDAKASIIELHKAQKDLDRARDPVRIQEYADAHTNALLRLDELNAKQVENVKTVGDLSAALRINTDVTALLGQAAALTATPLDDINTVGGDITTTYAAKGGVNASLGITSKSLSDIGSNGGSAANSLYGVNTAISRITVDTSKAVGLSSLSSALVGLASAGVSLKTVDFQGVLGGVISKVAELTVALVTPWTALNAALAETLKKIEALSKAGSGSGSGNDEKEIRNRVQTAFSDKYLSESEYGMIQGYASSKGIASGTVDTYIKEFLSAAGKDYTTYNKPVFGQLLPGSGGGSMGGGDSLFGGKSVTIVLNYATPPNSSNPLKDVEDYITAQGGLIRI